MQILERPTQVAATAGPEAEIEAEHSEDAIGQRPPRGVSTSMDDFVEASQRKKRRELEQARMAGAGETQQVQQVIRGEKIGRNDPCHCGSGKKYKKCHGANG